MKNEKRNVSDPFGAFGDARGDGTDHVTTGGSGNVLRLGHGITAADLKLGLGSLALQVGADSNKGFDGNDTIADSERLSGTSKRWRNCDRNANRSAANGTVFEMRKKA